MIHICNYGKIDVFVYDEFSQELKDMWTNFYNNHVTGTYNLSYEWCITWWKYFGINKQLHIVMMCEKDQIKLIAPFYKKGKSIYLIGEEPDLFDDFNVLYSDEKHLSKLIDYIEENSLDIDFRYVNSSTDIGKLLIKRLYRRKISYFSKIIDTKPFIEKNNFTVSKKLKQDIIRCKNNVVKGLELPLKFVLESEKNVSFINDFINIHKNRWNGGPFSNLKDYDKFITDLFLNTEVVVLSRLILEGTNNTLAYHLGYRGSDNVLYSAVPAYNIQYKDYSPGKILLHDLITQSFEDKYIKFDFGRGAEDYKYWFSDDSDVLYNIKTFDQSNKYLHKFIYLWQKTLGYILRKYI